MEKVKFIILFRGNWITSDDIVEKYVSGKERPICIDTNIDFEKFVDKICNRLKFDWSKANVHIFIVSDALVDFIEIEDNDDLEYVMIEKGSLWGLIKLYINQTSIEERDNQLNEKIYVTKKEDHHTYNWAESRIFQEYGIDYSDGDNDDDADEDHNTKNNDNDNDEFKGLYDDDNTDCIPSEEVVTSQINKEVESNAGHHDSIDIRAYTSHIYNPNLF